ncbi:MAG: DUF4198 domain-containing protein [Lautropia sp.]
MTAKNSRRHRVSVRSLQSVLAAASLAAAMLPATASAHRSFLVPSSTVLSGPGQWLTVDAARGNDLFYFNHNAMPVDGLVITAPDGRTVPPAKLERFRYRTVFDVQLTESGTWRTAVVDEGLRAQWQENGQPKRWNGSRSDFAKAVPSGAQKLTVSEVQSRVEVFVTAGKPTPIKPTGRGLEVDYTPHPNDLVAGEASELRFLADGKPAAGLQVKVVPGGNRYRDTTGEMKMTADADGRVSITWPHPGLYWVNAGIRGTAEPPATRRLVTYAATVEVLSK